MIDRSKHGRLITLTCPFCKRGISWSEYLGDHCQARGKHGGEAERLRQLRDRARRRGRLCARKHRRKILQALEKK